MATRPEITSSILRQVEQSLGVHIRRCKREERANNDSKYIIELDGTPEPCVLAICDYTSLLDKAHLVDRLTFFFTLRGIIVKESDVSKAIYPFPAFGLFRHREETVPFLDLIDESVIIVVNELVKDRYGKNTNVQELINRHPSSLTPHLVHQAGEYLGTIHRFAIANSKRLPRSTPVRLLDIVSSQLRKWKDDIRRCNDSDIYHGLENEYRDIKKWGHAFQRAENECNCWCLLDYYPVNTIATSRGLCFVDFGTAGRANPLYDLAMAIDAWCSKYDDPDLELVEQFLLGYCGQCGVAMPEASLLYRMIRLSILRWGVNRAVNKIAPPTWCTPSEPIQNLRKLAKWKVHEEAFDAVLSAVNPRTRGRRSKRGRAATSS